MLGDYEISDLGKSDTEEESFISKQDKKTSSVLKGWSVFHICIYDIILVVI